MKVFSAFDGVSCLMLALQEAGIPVESYQCCEIDKYASAVSRCVFPFFKRFDDMRTWREQDIEPMDLLAGGSPCQGFSFNGKGLNFEDPRSKLFFEFADMKEHFKPKYFLLENVPMKKESQDIISERMGVEPIVLNSALVSGQNRKRLYWTNIPIMGTPEDQGIMLKDILQTSGEPAKKVDGKFVLTKDKSLCLDANYFKGLDNHGQRSVILVDRDKANCITASYRTKGPEDYINKSKGQQCIELDKADIKEKKIAVDRAHWRKLTPIECERLQTMPDNHTQFGFFIDSRVRVKKISNTQRYKMIGNRWTVKLIAWILGGLNAETAK